MQKLFHTVKELDQRCYDKYGLSEDILMEHAADALNLDIRHQLPKGASVMILCGPGNNGADGLACARLLYLDYDVYIVSPLGAHSKMAKRQLDRCNNIGLDVINTVNLDQGFDCYVDAFFGSGFNRTLPQSIETILLNVNSKNGYKLACDLPSGLDRKGHIESVSFKADRTITMGALKTALYSDCAKDIVGEVVVANLGLCRSLYEGESELNLLDKFDAFWPIRQAQNVHKGDFGHLSVVVGAQVGAPVMAAQAGLRFGAGLVTLVSDKPSLIPPQLMQTPEIPEKSTALCLGMGLGADYDVDMIKPYLRSKPVVIDADLLRYEVLPDLLSIGSPSIVLTPHLGEFSQMVSAVMREKLSPKVLMEDLVSYVQAYLKRVGPCTLVLKGANTIIANEDNLYICTLGSNRLSKAGSGDLLAGMIGSLLAQGYTPLDAAITAVIGHAEAANRCRKESFALTAEDILDAIGQLQES
jgi:ADP-dependent NAD(P)H-hydrate dehydratase / NAD(P)H-hydrate epimerase